MEQSKIGNKAHVHERTDVLGQESVREGEEEWREGGGREGRGDGGNQ